MKKSIKSKSLPAKPKVETGIAELINRIELRLSVMEGKLDLLINQPPARSFDHPQRHERPRYGNGPRERTYHRVVCAECGKECEIPFKPSGDRPVYCKECFSRRKTGSSFNTNRDNRPEGRDFPRERSFDKSQTEKRQKPVKKKKSFFARRKKRA